MFSQRKIYNNKELIHKLENLDACMLSSVERDWPHQLQYLLKPLSSAPVILLRIALKLSKHWKIFEGELLISSCFTCVHQIFSEDYFHMIDITKIIIQFGCYRQGWVEDRIWLSQCVSIPCESLLLWLMACLVFGQGHFILSNTYMQCIYAWM